MSYICSDIPAGESRKEYTILTAELLALAPWLADQGLQVGDPIVIDRGWKPCDTVLIYKHQTT